MRLIVLALLLAAQDPPPELCTLAGSVVNFVTGEPLSRVQLFAEPADESNAPASTTTDAKGNFTLVALKPGLYRLSGKRNGYLYTYYGARRAGNKGTAIALSPGQQMKDLQFKLIPFAVISGTVREADGEPIAGASVSVIQLLYGAEGLELRYREHSYTDDLGQYRISDLTAGRYYVRAAPARFRDPTEEQAEDHGPKSAPPQIQAGSIYGGAPDLASARPVEVGPGARVSGIDITLPRSRAFRVSGHVTVPAGWTASLRLRSGGIADVSGEDYSGRVRAGEFEIRGVPAGSYTLFAYAEKYADKPPDDGAYLALNPSLLRAALPVEVGGRDVEGLQITIDAGSEIVGAIVVENVKDSKPTGGTVRFHGVYDPAAFLKRDNTFSAMLPPGRYEVYHDLSDNTTGLTVKSIRSGSLDILREGLTIQGPGKIPIEIVLSADAGSVDGVALDKDENPVAGATVVVIPDPVFRKRSDRYFTAGADQNGRFQIKGIPPGEYKLFAWDDVEPGAWFDADFLRPVEGRGETIKLDAKGNASVRLHLVTK